VPNPAEQERWAAILSHHEKFHPSKGRALGPASAIGLFVNSPWKKSTARAGEERSTA